jgi:hypothetical protein
MKKLWGLSRLARLAVVAGAILGTLSVSAATLEWSPNPESDNIAFYTVYVESASGTSTNEVRDGTRFNLDALLPNIPYTLFVTATSTAGLESDRSEGMPYLVTIGAPSISTHPSNTVLASGSLLSLSVTAASATPLTYQWRKDGQPLTGQTSADLAIANASVSHSGSYTVVVSNSGGSVESNPAQVIVQVAPDIHTQPQSAGIPLGTEMLLSLGANGTALRYQWFKGAQPITGQTNSTLRIATVTASDQANYHATVSNLVGNATSAVAAITILHPPTILTQPTSKDILDGSLLELTVVAEGSGTLSYQWYFNNSPINGATSALFQIAAATSANAGTYKVAVSNTAGSIESATATIRVLPRIAILQQPASTNLQLGAALTLAVQATGPDPLTYQWLRSGQPISGATTPQFQIAQISLTDAGAYTVRISSSLETITSAAAQVTILQSPPIIVSQPRSAQVALGAQHLLTVAAEGTDLTYQWRKNDIAIPGATSATFDLSNFSSADQGTYRVTVTNLFGSVTSEPATLSLISPPVILTSPASTNLAAGGTIQLLVEASGTSPFAYQWFKDATPLAARTNQSLTISSTTTNDSGAYHVRVTNPSGEATSSAATVLVLDPPRILTQPLSTNLLEGSHLALSVLASGSGTLSYQWSLNGAPISGVTNSSFEIVSVAPASAGSYTVRISNSIGAVTSTAATVQVVPAINIVQQPASTNLAAGGQIYLVVQATGPAPLTYQWFRNDVKIGGKTAPELLISNTTTSDSGTYTVEISSVVQKVLSAPAQVSVTVPTSVTDCALTMTTSSDGSLRIQGIAPPNTTYELQRTDSLTQPRWRRVQNVSTKSDGTFEITLSTTASSGFVRTIRR